VDLRAYFRLKPQVAAENSLSLCKICQIIYNIHTKLNYTKFLLLGIMKERVGAFLPFSVGNNYWLMDSALKIFNKLAY